MLDVRCAVCGSDDIYVKFPSTYNDEVKSVYELWEQRICQE